MIELETKEVSVVVRVTTDEETPITNATVTIAGKQPSYRELLIKQVTDEDGYIERQIEYIDDIPVRVEVTAKVDNVFRTVSRYAIITSDGLYINAVYEIKKTANETARATQRK